MTQVIRVVRQGPAGADASGDVVGPPISADGQIALFDGVTGQLLKSVDSFYVDPDTGDLGIPLGMKIVGIEGPLEIGPESQGVLVGGDLNLTTSGGTEQPGNINITAGDGTVEGASVNITAGADAGSQSGGGSVVITGGASPDLPGGVSIIGGAATGTGAGGGATVKGGAASGSNQNGGNVFLQPGARTGSGVVGKVKLVGASGTSALDLSSLSGAEKTLTVPNQTGTIALVGGSTGTRSVLTQSLGGQDNYPQVGIDFSRYSVIILQPTMSTLGGDNIVKLSITPDPLSGTGILKWQYGQYGDTNLIFSTTAFNNAFQNAYGFLDLANSGTPSPWTTNEVTFRVTLVGTDQYLIELLEVA